MKHRTKGRIVAKKGSTGFTLIELLVVCAIIGLLLAMILPAILRSRESARSIQCRNHLRQSGIALFTGANQRPTGRLCTGLFDYGRNGCMDTWGWVADVQAVGAMPPEAMRCPSNPIRSSEKHLDSYGIPTNDNLNRPTSAIAQRLTDGICGQDEWKGSRGPAPAGTGFASTAPLTEERAALIARYFIDRGYDTNYVSSWFLTYTAPRVMIREADGSLRTAGQSAQQGLRGHRETLGPLTLSFLAESKLPSSIVPLLGDAAPGDIDEAISPIAFGYSADDDFAGDQLESRVLIREGSILCESSTEGPAYYHRSDRKIKRIGSRLSRLDAQWECDRDRNCGDATGPPGNGLYRQSTLGWMAVHRSGGGQSLNMLMGDGSISVFADLNNDLYLNPGFPVHDDLTDQQYRDIGYRDSQVELAPFRFFSGVFLRPELIRRNAFN